MKEKDIVEKNLISIPEVFADIGNVLLFQGKRQIIEEELQDVSEHSIYKADDGLLHELERDIAKKWIKNNIVVAFVGIENQTQAEKYEPVKIIGYEGANYRSQLLKQKETQRKKKGGIKRIYLVITIILYFGVKHWKYPKNLKSVIDIPEELDEFVNDYKIHVCEVAWLEEETVAKFKSDFYIVADYFVQMRKNKEYKPTERQIKHVDALLKAMAVFTRDNRFVEATYNYKEKREVGNMCEALDIVENRGIEKGIEKGIRALISSLKELEISEEQIIKKVSEKFEITPEKVEKYLS